MNQKAFTLIELLIVVAIIAILAAIAVPNFLEAQTRAKVSASKADLRSLVQAIQSYQVDWNSYPYYPDELLPASFMDSQNPLTIRNWKGYTPWSLTTPLAYMTSLPTDKFAFAKADRVGSLNPLQLYQFDHKRTPLFTQIINWRGPESVDFVLVGVGPDLFSMVTTDSSLFHNNIDEYLQIRDFGFPISVNGFYDPTNGTVSQGDIVYHGPGVGFEPKVFSYPKQ